MAYRTITVTADIINKECTIYFVGSLVPECRLQTAHFTFSLGTRPRSYIVSMLS